jgi:hypothetical protein
VASVELARQHWEEGQRRVEAESRDVRRAAQLQAQVEAVGAELRRRVGQTFTLADLARAYEGADDWSRTAVAEASRAPGWLEAVAFVEAAAFHAYARGAVDYRP